MTSYKEGLKCASVFSKWLRKFPAIRMSLLLLFIKIPCFVLMTWSFLEHILLTLSRQHLPQTHLKYKEEDCFHDMTSK